jgi:hypothetical protein
LTDSSNFFLVRCGIAGFEGGSVDEQQQQQQQQQVLPTGIPAPGEYLLPHTQLELGHSMVFSIIASFPYRIYPKNCRVLFALLSKKDVLALSWIDSDIAPGLGWMLGDFEAHRRD